MIPLLITVAILLAIHTVRKVGLLAPPALFNVFSAVCLVVFYLVSEGLLNRTRGAGVSFRVAGSADVAVVAALVYIGLMLVALLATSGLSKNSAARLPDQTALYSRIVGRLLQSPLLTIIYGMLVVLAIWHFNSMDRDLFWQNSHYLTINDPAKMEISNPVCSAFHLVVGPLGLLTGCLACYYSSVRKVFPWALLTAVAGYCFVIKWASFSRWSAVMPLAFAACLFLSSQNNRRRFWLSVILGLAAFYLFFVALSGRSGANQGLSGAISVTRSMNWDSVPVAAQLMLNPFQGPLILASALQTTPEYPNAYQILSFSPLPSSIDGFQNLQTFQVRVNTFTPFNTFAEIWDFKRIYLILFVLIFWWGLRTLTRISLQSGPFIGMLLTAGGSFSILSMSQYPLRNSFRLFFYTVLATQLCHWYSQRQVAVVLARERRRRREHESGESDALPVAEAVYV